MKPILEAINVAKTFSASVPVAALRGVSLSIEAGTMVAIMGPSGSGKSTLLHILGALERPSDGEVWLEGRELRSLSNEQLTLLRRTRIGFIFQQFNLLPTFTVAENVALPLRLAGVSSKEAAARAVEMLSLVGLREKLDRLPSQLSGGEQQRVAISRSMITNPALILADEPTGNLDSVNGHQVVEHLRKLVDQMQQTVVLVTHDAQIADYADRVITMRDGVIADSTVPDSLPNPAARTPELQR